ncbi:hypothetical protein QTN25_001378 [Entamoeba marina]
MKISNTISNRLETIHLNDIDYFLKEISKVSVRRYLEEFGRKLLDNKFEDLAILLIVVELCNTLQQMYGDAFTQPFEKALEEKFKERKTEYPFFCFVVCLVLIQFPGLPKILSNCFQTGFTYFTFHKNIPEINASTDIRLNEVVHLIKLIGSVMTYFEQPLPSLSNSMNELMEKEGVNDGIKEQMGALIRNHAFIENVITSYRTNVAMKFLSTSHSNEVEESIKTLMSYSGVKQETIFMKSTTKTNDNSTELYDLYEDSETLYFYTKFPDLSHLMKVRTENGFVNIGSLRKHVSSLRNITDVEDIQQSVEEFLKRYRTFAIREFKLTNYVALIVEKETNPYHIPFLSRYLYIISLHININISSILLQQFESMEKFHQANNYMIFISEFFKFSTEKKYTLSAYKYLLSSKSTFPASKN